MKKRAVLTTSAAFLAMLVIAGVALGVSHQAGFTLRSSLDANQQVPPQAVKAPKAKATFTGTLTTLSDGRGKLTWSLSYSNLSSPATKGLLVIPQYKTKPAAVVEFCRGCKAHATGLVTPLPIRVAKALTTRAAWVSVRTKRNPKGEIRGRIVITRS
jgi:hypothetical protein